MQTFSCKECCECRNLPKYKKDSKCFSKTSLNQKYYFHCLYCLFNGKNNLNDLVMPYYVAEIISDYTIGIFLVEEMKKCEMFVLRHSIIYNRFHRVGFNNRLWTMMKRSDMCDLLQTWNDLNPIILNSYIENKKLKMPMHNKPYLNLTQWLSKQWQETCKEIVTAQNNPVIELSDFSLKIDNKVFAGIPCIKDCLILFEEIKEKTRLKHLWNYNAENKK